mmetsp:Transcript_9279/g.28954  ORF Transcript_9279/g.28954 Transcript_9279/m.28954 type:complete len:269 (+) Transcript_9279:507-1313(+)
MVVPADVVRTVLRQQRPEPLDEALRGAVAAGAPDGEVPGHPEVVGVAGPELALQPRPLLLSQGPAQLPVPAQACAMAKAPQLLVNELVIDGLVAAEDYGVKHNDLQRAWKAIRLEVLADLVPQGGHLPLLGPLRVGQLRGDVRGQALAVVVVAQHGVEGQPRQPRGVDLLEGLAEARGGVAAGGHADAVVVEVVAQQHGELGAGLQRHAGQAVRGEPLALGAGLLVVLAAPVADGNEAQLGPNRRGRGTDAKGERREAPHGRWAGRRI